MPSGAASAHTKDGAILAPSGEAFDEVTNFGRSQKAY
jgi:hypothetical protein